MSRLIRESRSLLFILIAFLVHPVGPAFSLNVGRLEPSDIHLVKTTLKILKPAIDRIKPSGAMNLLTFDELYSVLSPTQKNFLDEIGNLDPRQLGATAHAFDPPPPETLFVKVPNQHIQRNGSLVALPRQYLPKEAHEAYQEMMAAMKKDLGKILHVESGYRSPAYQLYLFLYYLPKHGYSIRENNRFVALPGHSEHGAPQQQAIDFINEEGINGEEHPEEFEALDEYAWLMEHAKKYGFFLSYPRDNPWGTSFEPWHWHYQGTHQ